MRTRNKAAVIAACLSVSAAACNNNVEVTTTAPIYVEAGIYETASETEEAEITEETSAPVAETTAPPVSETTDITTEEPEIDYTLLGDLEQNPLQGEYTRAMIAITSPNPVKISTKMVTSDGETERMSRKEDSSVLLRADNLYENGLIDRVLSSAEEYPFFTAFYDMYGDYLDSINFEFERLMPEDLTEEQQKVLYYNKALEEETGDGTLYGEALDAYSFDGEYTYSVDFTDFRLCATASDSGNVRIRYKSGLTIEDCADKSEFAIHIVPMSDENIEKYGYSEVYITGKIRGIPNQDDIKSNIYLLCNEEGFTVKSDTTVLMDDLNMTYTLFGEETEKVLNLPSANGFYYVKETGEINVTNIS